MTDSFIFYILGGIMRASLLRRVLPVAILACTLTSAPHLAAQALNTNLIVNPGAENSAGAANFTDTAPPAGWTTTSNMTAVQYAIGGATDLNAADSTAIGGGNNYFSGGPQNGSSSAAQTISLAGLANAIDAGGLIAKLSGYLGGFGNQSDSATLTAVFRAAGGAALSSFTIGPVTDIDRGAISQLLFRSNMAAVPVGTRSVEITLVATRSAPAYNDGYADNLRFEIVQPGTPVSDTFYWTNLGNTNAYGYGAFNWDGISLSATTTPLASLAPLTVNGSLVVGADGNIYSGRAGSVSQINPTSGAVVDANAGINNNVISIDPGRSSIFAGWKDSDLSFFFIGGGFNDGSVRNVTGDDGVATGLAWDNTGTVWYTTGGEDAVGNVGTITIGTFVTVRKLTGISATAIVFDSFTGHLFTAGINGIAQINPATGTVVSTWTNPRGPGYFIQNLTVTQKGHLLALDSNGLLRIWDLTAGTRLIGSPDTIQGSSLTAVTNGGMTLAALPPFPIITSPLKANGTLGRRFVYQFEVQNGVPRSVSGLPPGLSFNNTLSAIVGTPTQAGTFQVTLNASNPANTIATTATLTLTIQAPPGAGPIILNNTAATGRTGQPFTFQVYISGGTPAARLSASGLPPGLAADPITGLISGTPTVDGSYAVNLSVTDNGQTATGIVQLTFSSDSFLPVIISANNVALVPGQPFSYTIDAPCDAPPSDPTTYSLIGTPPPGLTFDAATGRIFGTPTAAAFARKGNSPNAPDLSGGVITNVQLFATNSHGTATIAFLFYLAPTGAVNIATRVAVGTGNDVLIAGFIITGNAPKKVIIRAIGPSLQFGNTLRDPTLELHGSSGLLGMNDNWRETQEDEIIATTVPPIDELESAIVAILNPGNYSAIVGGKNNGVGIGVVEVYDLGTASLDIASNAKLAQISTRGKVLTGDDIMIGGFILSGPPSKVIVRAIGPSLSAFLSGALPDTVLELRDMSGNLVAANDDWRSSQEQEIIDTTVPPSDNHESAIVQTLSPGNYTGIVRGKNNATGVALVEVYGLN